MHCEKTCSPIFYAYFSLGTGMAFSPQIFIPLLYIFLSPSQLRSTDTDVEILLILHGVISVGIAMASIIWRATDSVFFSCCFNVAVFDWRWMIRVRDINISHRGRESFIYTCFMMSFMIHFIMKLCLFLWMRCVWHVKEFILGKILSTSASSLKLKGFSCNKIVVKVVLCFLFCYMRWGVWKINGIFIVNKLWIFLHKLFFEGK